MCLDEDLCVLSKRFHRGLMGVELGFQCEHVLQQGAAVFADGGETRYFYEDRFGTSWLLARQGDGSFIDPLNGRQFWPISLNSSLSRIAADLCEATTEIYSRDKDHPFAGAIIQKWRSSSFSGRGSKMFHRRS
ncbi:hypothetical protein ATN84_18630 [Paramesorhizobium deserti]|uniref:Uncharacterized protein n=1 Tax=Paramesorhizobium deserti TaxID=1494590 RepID=A0A135HQ14_9HYPH|nr:hypothetical protein ATN84_18630 [Paramesorhizobium deserti]